MKKAIVIGSGFSGLSTAAFLAKAGFQVKVVEKNQDLGGRARVFRKNGFIYDGGPTVITLSLIHISEPTRPY